jgi:hypothetical protein
MKEIENKEIVPKINRYDSSVSRMVCGQAGTCKVSGPRQHDHSAKATVCMPTAPGGNAKTA